jgi:hypothetical protein
MKRMTGKEIVTCATIEFVTAASRRFWLRGQDGRPAGRSYEDLLMAD